MRIRLCEKRLDHIEQSARLFDVRADDRVVIGGVTFETDGSPITAGTVQIDQAIAVWTEA